MLSYMSQLSALALSGNSMSSIPRFALNVFPKLSVLDLSDNSIAADIEKGSLNELPSSLGTLYLKNVGLTSVPANLLQRNPQIDSLDFSNNQITKVLSTDFLASRKLEYLLLEGNPISKIERGSFQLLNNSLYIVLSNTSIPDVDFSLFAGMGRTVVSTDLYLDDNAMMKSLSLTSADQAPSKFEIHATNTALETIDGSCEALFTSPGVSLDLSNNPHLQCATLNWLAPYVLCSKQVITNNNTICADQKNVLLDAYLQSVMKGPCPSVATTKAPTTAPAGTTGPTIPPTTTPPYNGSIQITVPFLMLLIAPLLMLILKN
jgi:Leucine-rich repeat (LRR) protein